MLTPVVGQLCGPGPSELVSWRQVGGVWSPLQGTRPSEGLVMIPSPVALGAFLLPLQPFSQVGTVPMLCDRSESR